MRAGKTSEKTLLGDWERLVCPVAASRSFLPGNHLFCRESHSFPRANLVILGHIKKLEFRIMALMTAELECFSITKTLMGHNDN